MEIAVETSVDPELALRHTELLQVAVEGKGPRPVQPNNRQVAVHRERRHILWGWRGTEGHFGCVFMFLQTA